MNYGGDEIPGLWNPWVSTSPGTPHALKFIQASKVSAGIDHRQGMLGNHRFLIRMADQHAHGIASSSNLRAIGNIGFRIKMDPKKTKPRADARTNPMRILAYAGGEHQGVYAADGSGQSTDFTPHAKGEVIKRGLSRFGAGGFNRAHILRYAGHALQAALVIEQMRDIGRFHLQRGWGLVSTQLYLGT